MKTIDKQYLLERVGKGLDCQFEMYSWDKMIDDALEDCTKEEKEWAKTHISYKAYIWNKERRKTRRIEMRKQVCQECGESVKAGSGKFINRVVNLDNGKFTCEECDEKLRKEVRK